MSRIKFTDSKVDKGVGQLSKEIKKKNAVTKVVSGVVKNSDVRTGEYVFTVVKAGQEGPSSPTTDESRIYFKDATGTLYKFTGTKVG